MPEEGAPELGHTGHAGRVREALPHRTYEEEMEFIERVTDWKYRIKKGFVPGMNVEGAFYINKDLDDLMLGELKDHCEAGGRGGFLPAVKQIANVAALPGIMSKSIGLPDVHSGYGFAIGNVAAFDMANPDSIVSPGGVGFDINCGVRLLRTNLTEAEVGPVKEQLAQSLFDHIPVGVGSKGVIPTSCRPTLPRCPRGPRSEGCRSWERWGQATTIARYRSWTRSSIRTLQREWE